MFKKIIIMKLLTLFILFYTPIFAQDEQKMTIRLNGHDNQVDDIFSKKIKELYEQEKQNIKDSMIVEIKRVQNDDFKELNINLPDNISVEYIFDTINNQDTLIASLSRIHTDFVLKDWTDCRVHVNFDLKMRFLLELQIDSLKLKVKLNPLDPVPYNIDVDTYENVPWLLEWWAHYFSCPALEWAI
ncbi:hypothetical protein [Caldithrix abyssi]